MSTIVALSTPLGIGAIAVVRMSGESALNIAQQIFSPFPKQPRLLGKGQIDADVFNDQAMCVYFKSPHSFTGEDMIEFHCHGGVGVYQAVIDKCIKLGCRMATNGEFSKRAFINGKLNLSNAEGMIEIINAETTLLVKNGQLLLTNKLIDKLTPTRQKLTEMLAAVEVALDYPEEDFEQSNIAYLRGAIAQCIDNVNKLLDTTKQGKLISSGINIAIVGKPNVGKSQLLNSLVCSDRAIVSDIAGTTRDTLDVCYIYNNIKYTFVDTAGLRDTTDKLEQLGIDRTHKAVANCDICLLVTDHQPIDAEEQQLLDELTVSYIVVYNKLDINDYREQDNSIAVSALKNTNIQQLQQTIYNKASGQISMTNDVVLTNSRHIDALSRARNHLQKAYDNLGKTQDIIALHLTDALSALCELDGSSCSQQVLDTVFAKFCIGK